MSCVLTTFFTFFYFRHVLVRFSNVFVRPFVKRFVLSYRTVVCLSWSWSGHVCSVCPVYDVGVLWLNGWIDQDETWHAGRPRHSVRWGPSSPTERGTAAPTFEIYGRRLCLCPYNPLPMSIVAKRLDGSRCHLEGK